MSQHEIVQIFKNEFGMIRNDYLQSHPDSPRPQYMIDHPEYDPKNIGNQKFRKKLIENSKEKSRKKNG